MRNKVFTGKLGSGKTKRIFNEIDELIQNNESFFVLDSNGEYQERYENILKNKDYNVKIINLRDLANSENFNPLYLPFKLYKEDKSDLYLDMLDMTIHAIVHDENVGDPFWINSSVDLIMGIILTLFYQEDINNINLSKVTDIINSNDLNQYFLEYHDTNAYKFAKGIINAPRETFGGIKATALQKLRLYSTRENLSKFLSVTSFDYSEFINKKTAIIFVNYDSISSYNDIALSFIKQIYLYLEGRITNNFTFILDNFDSLGYVKDFKEIISTSNSYNINFIIATWDYDELKRLFSNIDKIADIESIALK